MLWNKLKIGVVRRVAVVAFVSAGGVGYRVVAGERPGEGSRSSGQGRPASGRRPGQGQRRPSSAEIDMKGYKGALPKTRPVYQCSVLTSLDDVTKGHPRTSTG